MKRVARTNLISATPVKRITIDVEYEFPSIFASEIKPLMNPDGTYDEAAIAEYEEFVVNVLGVFDECDYEVIEEAESDRSKSMYYSLVKKSDNESESYKYILFIRISDHVLSDRSKVARQSYYSDKAEQLKQPKDKRKQTWRLKDVVVNGQTFDSYDDALEDIERRLK